LSLKFEKLAFPPTYVKALKTIPWTADYKPPAPPDENTMTKKTPEEIEREIKLQEMELQKLVLVDLKLPASALWFEPPTIVRSC
jgi:hypothetical protein